MGRAGGPRRAPPRRRVAATRRPRPSPRAGGAGLASAERLNGGARARGLQPSRTPAARHLSPGSAPRGLVNWRFHLASVSVCPLRKAKTRRPAPGAGSAGRTGPAGGARPQRSPAAGGRRLLPPGPGPGALFSAGGRFPGPDTGLRSHGRRGGEGGGALGAGGGFWHLRLSGRES